MKNVIVLTMIALASVSASAENYYVDPLVCTGKWNERPEQYHPSYEYGGFTVVSFKSVRAKDCSLADSSGTATVYGEEAKKLSVLDPVDYVGSWFAGPLRKVGKTVTVPYGVVPNEMTLEVVGSHTTELGTFDTLKGRQELYGKYYYEFECNAKVVRNVTRIVNNTTRCSP